MTSNGYTSTGGLVFFATALSLLLQADVSSAWSMPRKFSRGIIAPPNQPSFKHVMDPHIASRTSLFSTPPPLAVEGDWAAYNDEQYNRVYYFNHVTGESVWSKPTPSFPDVNISDGEDYSDEYAQGFGQAEQDITGEAPNLNSKPTLYEILNISRDATRDEIKRSYLDLAKQFHPDTVAKLGGDPAEGNRVFNDISRAWMVLSDDGLRRGYDETLDDQWKTNNDISNTEEIDSESMESSHDQVDNDGIRDATIVGVNKFEKNPVYKKKVEMGMADGRGNKFARGGPSRPNPRIPPPNVIAPAPPLEIDYEAEAAAFRQYPYYPQRGPLTASQATLLAQNAWRDAITAEKASLQRDAQSASEELRAAQFRAQQWNAELENERREQQMQMQRRQEERRRSAERGVVDGGNFGGVTMEERLRMRKMKTMERAEREAERVGKELTKLGGLGAGFGSSDGARSVGGGPSEKPDAFFGGGQTQRSTARSSSDIREEQRLNSLQQKGAAARQGQHQRGGPVVVERSGIASTTVTEVEKKIPTRNMDKEISELKNKYEAEIDRLKTEMMQIADKSESSQLKELVGNHKKELERVKKEIETASNERLENELHKLEEKHRKEIKMMEEQLQPEDTPVSMGKLEIGSDKRVQEMDIVVNKLKEEHAMEVAKLKEELSNNAKDDQTERLQQLDVSHKKAIEQLRIDMEATSAKEIQTKLQEMEAAHKWQLQSLQSGHQAEMSKSQKEAAEKLRWEVERSIASLKRDHEREIQKLRIEAMMNVSQSDAMEAMQLNHEAEMELLRAELFGEAASDLEDAIASLNRGHQAEIAKVRDELEKKAEEQMQRLQQEYQENMAADLEAKTSAVEREQEKDMEQIKQEILANANLTESDQVKRLEESHRQEINALKRAANTRLEEEILKIAKIHAGEITKLRDDLEASAANTIRDIQTDSARQRQMEVERAVSQLKMQHEQEREHIRQELLREIEQDTGTRVFSQKAEMERLKSDLDLQAKQIMAAEIRKLKQVHIGEMDKLKRDIERSYSDKMEQLKKDLNQKKMSEIESLTKDMKQMHTQELDRVMGEMSRSSNPNSAREINRLEELHKRDMTKLRNDLTAQAESNLQQKIDELTQLHRQDIEELKRSMKAAAVADTLQFQTQANVQRTAEVDRATQDLKKAHQKELELLRKSMMVNASSSEKERMEILEASHRSEIERIKAQMEASFVKKMENELQLLERSHQKQLTAVKDEISAKTRELENREASMNADREKRIQQVQSEMQAMKAAHASEILTLKSNLLKNSDASYQKQIDELTASFNAELERVKSAAGNTQMASLFSSPPQNIDEVLNGLQSVYPPETVEKLRQELKARNADLSRLGKDISSNTQQMNALQTKLSLSESSQQTLTKTIQSLEIWKQKAKADIETKAAQLQAATEELERLKGDVSMRAQSSDAVTTLQKEIRTKTNELANLNTKIRSLKTETSDLKLRLEAIDKEKAAMLIEINELKKWKQEAEVNQKKEREELESQISRLKQELVGTKNVHKEELNKMDNKLKAEAQDKRSVIAKFTREISGKDEKIKRLEGNLSAKDSEIDTLKIGLRERHEDVNTLVPEVARLQTLNAEMKSVNDARVKEFSILKTEAERLKSEFEKGNKEHLATVNQLTTKLESEQSRHEVFIKNLEQNAKAKAEEISNLQSNLSDKTKKISDLEKKLGSLGKMSSDLASLEEYRVNTEISIAESKRTIQALQNDLAKGKAEDAQKNARIKELERLQESMFGKDGEIQRLKKDLAASGEEISRLKSELDVSHTTQKKMAQDISEFKSVRYSSEASLKKTTNDLSISQREVARMKREIENMKQSDSSKTLSLKDLERKLTEKEAQLKTALTSKESEVSRLSRNAKDFASERERLLVEVERLSKWKVSAEETISVQCKKIEMINLQLKRLESELASTPSSEYETLLQERATLIEKLAFVKTEFVEKNDKIKTTKIQTENLMRRNMGFSSPPPPRASVRTLKTPIISNNNVIGDFIESRRRNIVTATEIPAAAAAKRIMTPAQQTPQPERPIQARSQETKQGEKVVVSPPKAPTLSEISSSMAATLTKEKTTASNTMSAYDLALQQAQDARKVTVPDAIKPSSAESVTSLKTETKDAAPMSGWAGHKNARWGGYLDNLSSTNSGQQSSTERETNGHKDDVQKGFSYLDNLSAKKPEDDPSRENKKSIKDEYLDAEKQYLLDAKNLAFSAAKNFQEAQSKPNDKDALERANSEKRKIDELLAKAREMRLKAEEM